MKNVRRISIALTLSSFLWFALTATATPRSPLPPVPSIGAIHHEGFNQPLFAGTNQVINSSTWVEDWSGYALNRTGKFVSPWTVPMVVSNSFRVDPERGAVRVWFRPAFSSGSGPGRVATLLTLVSSDGNTEASWWSLVLGEDGSSIHVLCEQSEGTSGCLSAEIKWAAGEWHLLTLGYTATNSALWVDDEVVAVGDGLPSVPQALWSDTRLVVGSDLSGGDVASGEFDELTVFTARNRFRSYMGQMFGLSETWDVMGYFAGMSKVAALGPVTEAELAARTKVIAERKAEREAKAALEGESEGGGMMMLRMSGPSAECVTAGPVYLTNVLCNFTTNDGYTVYFDIMGGETNPGPYDIFSTPALVGNDVTNSVWTWLETGNSCETHYYTNQPTNQTFYILTLPGADRDGDGMYDGWEWKHFGTLEQPPGGDYDNDGESNASELANGTDPNTIGFSASFGYGQVATTNPTVNIEVLSGVPEFIAVMVDATNSPGVNLFPNAQWLAYTSSPTVLLPSNSGPHQVWIGLRGHSLNVLPVWRGLRVVLDQTPPDIAITEPAGATVFKPVVQVKGTSKDKLLEISCTLSNAVGVETNLGVFITGEYGGTNRFQCFDVPLTNGLNVIALTLKDVAGNSATTNISLTYDPVADTNPPVIGIYWPQSGAQVAATNFTVRGWIDDETATVTAQIVGGGVTNVTTAFVERNGNLWVDDLPLANGTNELTLTANDVAGNLNTTNITVVKSSVSLTIDEPSPESLHQPVATVSGTISASGYKIWVNGIAATESGGTWTALNVPVTSGGSAVFAVAAIPISDNGGNGTPPGALNQDPASSNPTSSGGTPGTGIQPEKPHQVVRVHSHWEGSHWVYTSSGVTGNAESEWTRTETNGSATAVIKNWVFGNYYESTVAYDPNNTNTTLDTFNGTALVGPGYYTLFEPLTSMLKGSWDTAGLNQYITVTHHEEADTKVVLRTGGRAGVSGRSLFVVTASAWDRTKNSAPEIPKTLIFIPAVGKNLGVDGRAYGALPDNEEIVITPETPAAYFKFTVDASKHKLAILANGYLLDPARVRPGAHFCVGQKLNFEATFVPTVPGLVTIEPVWKFSGDFINHHAPIIGGCEVYSVASYWFTQNPTHLWYYGGESGGDAEKTLAAGINCHFENGQRTYPMARGKFNVYTPDNSFWQIGTPTVNVDQSIHCGQISLQVGQQNGTGMIYLTGNVKSKFPGEVIGTQLCSCWWQRIANNPPDTYTGGTGGEFALDHAEIYPDSHQSLKLGSDGLYEGSVDVLDQPCLGLLVFQAASRNDSFRTYFRFRPSGADSIYVTLARADWNWFGNAEETGAYTWVLNSGGVTGPNFSSAHDFPFWLFTFMP